MYIYACVYVFVHLSLRDSRRGEGLDGAKTPDCPDTAFFQRHRAVSCVAGLECSLRHTHGQTDIDTNTQTQTQT